ncbi:hypothetical protein chiPu_0032303, partial [Chiloscyllium punctatum]|nr:hypothetical protein [Chiloscyllium punctatum]
CDPKRESCQLCNYIQESGSLTPGLVPLTAFAFSGLGLMTVVVLGYLVWKTWKKRSPSSPGKIPHLPDPSRTPTVGFGVHWGTV